MKEDLGEEEVEEGLEEGLKRKIKDVEKSDKKIKLGESEMVNMQEQEIKQLKELLIDEKILNAMLVAGIKSDRAKRAVKLVDKENVCIDGEINEEELKAEIDDIINEFPEIKNQIEVTEKTGFKIGSDGEQKTSTKERLSNIFGNIK